MLNHDLQREDGILVLTPEGVLEKADFTTLSAEVDAYLEQRASLRGVMIRASSIPGWRDFGALIAHLKFVRQHIGKIEKVALVVPGAFANIMPAIVNHFIHAEVQRFDPAREDFAMAWLRQAGDAQILPAA